MTNEYVYPPNLKKELIPEVIAFFDQIRESIPDDVLFKKKIMVGGCEFVYGWGRCAVDFPPIKKPRTRG